VQADEDNLTARAPPFLLLLQMQVLLLPGGLLGDPGQGVAMISIEISRSHQPLENPVTTLARGY